MNLKFRLFRRRGGFYYYEDRKTRKQLSLGTKDKNEAIRLFHAHNEAEKTGGLSAQIARVYLNACDPALATRTWRIVTVQLIGTKQGKNRERWERAILDKALDSIQDLPLADTRPDHFFKVLKEGTVSTNVFLRRIHNFALGCGWLHWHVLPPRQWPKPKYKDHRAITEDEHKQIIARETSAERRSYYELLWELGGSQSDIAGLQAEDVDRKGRLISYIRLKTKEIARVSVSIYPSNSVTPVRVTSTFYSPDHQSVTVTNGTGAAAIATTTYTDTDGHTVLTLHYPTNGITEYEWQQYDLGGNRLAWQQCANNNGSVTVWATNGWTYDGLNRMVPQRTTTKPLNSHLQPGPKRGCNGNGKRHHKRRSITL